MEQYQILKNRMNEGLTRFANSTIHQNTVRDETETKILFAIDKKIGILSSIGREPNLKMAKEIALNSKENTDFVSLPDPDEAGKPIFKGSFSDATSDISPKTRAKLVKDILQLCKENGLQAAGFLSTGLFEQEVENSLDVKRKDRTSFATFTITTIGEGTGYATATAYDLNLVDIKKLTSEAIDTALKNVNPVNIEPGMYQVLLEPLAVHELFQHLSFIGFSGMFYDDGRSCFSGMLNQKVTSPLLTFYDEPIHDLPGLGIDVEGVARKKIILVENGVLKNIAYDSYSAHKVGKKSTGNAFYLISPYGGFPFSMSIVPGKNSPEDMLKEIRKGLLIKRFWYTRVVSWKEGILTGMTRDGTFSVLNGKIDKPIKNLRFQISLPDLFKKVMMVGNILSLYEYGRYPHLLIDDFKITGLTG